MHNEELHQQSLADGSYRGEEGILRLRPDTARSLGLKVPDYETHRSAMVLLQEADLLWARAEQALVSQAEEASPEGHAREAAENALEAKRKQEEGWKQLVSHRSDLAAADDERLHAATCSGLMDKLILESLALRGFNLRESLADFYNRSAGGAERASPLHENNVKFVNVVFDRFTRRASQGSLQNLDLDRMEARWRGTPLAGWKCPLDGSLAQYIAHLEEIVTDQYGSSFPVDPLLFFALMRRESAFDSRAVSSVGAAGLTQIMPKTALDMGMGNIYLPSYLNEAKEHLLLERRLKHKALTLIRGLDADGALSRATKARQLMQRSLGHGRKRAELYSRYRQELLLAGKDDRLQPKKAMVFGLRYLCAMLRLHEGDISLALAGYNAGPHRVREYGGIPPYGETVSFRNAVLGHYREYLRRAADPSCRDRLN